jgi:ribosome-associated toxin RatA of RatAB toxin-antitoxin module
MKKLLLAFMITISFAPQVSANMYDIINDLDLIYETALQMRKQEEIQKQQEKDNKKRLVVDVRNILKSSDGKNLFKNLFGSKKKRDLSSLDMAHLINTYKINRE